MANTPPPVFHPSFGQPDDEFVYTARGIADKRTGPSVPVTVPPAAIHPLFAHRQWRAGMLLADAIFSGAVPVHGKTVVELGAGTALPAIVAARCGAARVVATDYDDPAVVSALKKNVARGVQGTNAPISACGHTWGRNCDDLTDLVPAGFDAVLLADCMWDQFAHADLLKSVVSILARTSTARVYAVSGFHTGREKIMHFIRRAAQLGLRLVPLDTFSGWPPLDAVPWADEPGTPLHHADYIVELEMGGMTGDEQTTHILSTPTGKRRAFMPRDESIGERNRWLTVFSLGWT